MKKQVILGLSLLCSFFITAQNIYNTNGTLTGNRTVGLGTYSLNFGSGKLFLANNGNIGIGTASPTVQFDVVKSSIRIDGFTDIGYFGYRDGSVNSGIKLQIANYTDIIDMSVIQVGKGFKIASQDNNVNMGYIEFNPYQTSNTTRSAVSFGSNNVEFMRINQNGKVRIGNGANDIKTPDGYKLFVEEGILTERVKVAIKTTTDWSDYVFEPAYNLMPLEEVEKFTKENKHLPNVPSAQHMTENGLDVAKMDAKLLEKIEELTLYIIQQQKEIDIMRDQIQIILNTKK